MWKLGNVIGIRDHTGFSDDPTISFRYLKRFKIFKKLHRFYCYDVYTWSNLMLQSTHNVKADNRSAIFYWVLNLFVKLVVLLIRISNIIEAKRNRVGRANFTAIKHSLKIIKFCYFSAILLYIFEIRI